jgi:hypothetical protein
LRKVLPDVLSSPPESLSPRLLHLIGELDQDWRRLDARLKALSAEIASLSEDDCACQRLMSVAGIGPITTSAVVAARWLMSEAAHSLDHDRRIADDTLAGPDQTSNRQPRGVGRLLRQPLVGPVLAQGDACRYRPTVNEAAMAMLDSGSI